MEERKLTGTGAYNIDDYEYEDHDDYSDDFESEDEEEQSTMISGCSGTTGDSGSRGQQNALGRGNTAMKAQELERCVEAYNMILENTVSDEDFAQYRPVLDESMRGPTSLTSHASSAR